MSLGVDVVEIERFRGVLDRNPGFLARFFTNEERAHCGTSLAGLAGTFAAKEAVMKAAGLTPAPAWARRIRVCRDASGKPVATVAGRTIAVSISHDGPVAVAVALDAQEAGAATPAS
ncbi:MAG TPA: holo-ACP synthase [Actinomycetota bacterium]|nr:holo-ACP synthase [Actinomycetota bacterium]